MDQRSTEGRQIRHYSLGFKQSVVQEIESGKISIFGAQQRYGIGGNTTIQGWIRKLGKSYLLPTTVHIRMKEEVDELRTARERIRQLEKALSDVTIDKLVAEAVLQVASAHYGTDLKKTFGSKP